MHFILWWRRKRLAESVGAALAHRGRPGLDAAWVYAFQARTDDTMSDVEREFAAEVAQAASRRAAGVNRADGLIDLALISGGAVVTLGWLFG